MQTGKWTPGPWSQDGFCLTSVIAEVGESKIGKIYKHVCDCNYGYLKPDENLDLNKANARLIAAAPEMLEALIKAIQVIKLWHGDEVFDIYLNKSPEMKSIREAIESATGMKIEEVLAS